MILRRTHTSKSKSKWIAITLGDPAGIGPEVVAQALRDRTLRRDARFVIIGDNALFERYRFKAYEGCHFVSTHRDSSFDAIVGTPTEASGLAALGYLKKAVDLLRKGHIHALATAPISKEAIHFSQPDFQGHTEFFANAFDTPDVGMMFACKKMKTVIVTRHLALKDVPSALTQEKILRTARLTDNALKEFYKITRPRLAMCGLNPHAGEKGAMGREEIDVIIPAIETLRHEGLDVQGPFPADTIFHQAQKYDAILAMYHDQGLIPIKTLYFDRVVNLTIGLPFVRTSPAHGTAYDIAGKNQADPSSMAAAIGLAKQLTSAH